MKVLIITQKVDKNDGYFGFFHGWLTEFSKQSERVTVIGLEVGAHALPANTTVYSLGKETKVSRLQYAWRLISYSWKERKNYDAVFVHMNPPYVLTAGWLWKLLGKRVGLWYVHRHVDLKLRLAHSLVDTVFTAVPESFNLKSNKVNYMGQAVPLESYAKPANMTKNVNSTFTIVSVGRITPIKNLDTLVEAAAVLRDKGMNLHIDLIGEPVKPEDKECKRKLVELIDKTNMGSVVTFVGNIPNKDIPSWYWKSDMSANLCPTGGLDKAVLESMAASTPVMVSNQAFRDYFGEYGARMIFKERDSADLAVKLGAFIKAGDKDKVTAKLLTEVEKRSSLQALIGKIIEILK